MSRGLGENKLHLHENSVAGDYEVATKYEYSAQTMLKLTFSLTGNLQSIILPEQSAQTWQDNLWQHTCFEAFIGLEDSNQYIEYNFSPSGAYAIYSFESYRFAMQPALNLVSPDITTQWHGPNAFQLIAYVDLGQLAHKKPMDMGLSAVIEQEPSTLAYWALAHPSDKPDFHNRDCFTIQLQPPICP
ncbi:DOMON-like domain-containing protein [Parasphingorhabdus sp. DH2-15]|uniref:DOMON-like domain-containing protein n=1 Tax=Parasphingorhabdus sp. DH2-15 TaxID=3444112 RepID=UPI003F6821DD